MRNYSFISYGLTTLRDRKYSIENHPYGNKPLHGFWASVPQGTPDARTWRDFCMDENWNRASLSSRIKFNLDHRAKILIIDSYKVFKSLPRDKRTQRAWGKVAVDWAEVFKRYDGVYLKYGKLLEDKSCPNGYYDFGLNIWDCDSLVLKSTKYIRIVK